MSRGCRVTLAGLVAVFGVAGTCLAGAMYQNTSGAAARAVKIEFSEPAEITSMYPSFPQRDPWSPATAITLSGGEVPAAGWFSFTWRPDSARVVEVRWLAEPDDADERPSDAESTQFDLRLASSDGSAVLQGRITRHVSSDRIPFSVRYETDFGDMPGLGFAWGCTKDNHTPVVDLPEATGWCPRECTAIYASTLADFLRVPDTPPETAEFLLLSNFPTYDFSLTIRDSEGREYTWRDTEIDLPLHNRTRITLDATKFVSADEIMSVTWSARNGDPTDAVTFPIADPGSPVTTLRSEWPNVLEVTASIQRMDGKVEEHTVEALIYFRDGCPFPIKSTAFSPNLDVGEDWVRIGVSEMYPMLKRAGFNAVTTAINWYYDYPDASNTYTLFPLYYGGGHPYSGKVEPTYPLWAYELLFETARECSFFSVVQMTQWALPHVPPDEFAYGPKLKGFLYGDGHAYEYQLLSHLDLFLRTGVDLVFLGAEIGIIEKIGGQTARDFYSRVIEKYRQAGYSGELSYAINYRWYPESPIPFNVEHIYLPSTVGIPWKDMDYIGLTFYPKLATHSDPSTAEMFAEAVRQVQNYLTPLSRSNGKPLFIEDFQGNAYDGIGMDPLQDEGRFDPEEQRRWVTAWFRALSQANHSQGSPVIAGITFGQYTGQPNMCLGRNCDPGRTYGPLEIWSYINAGAHRPDLIKMAMVYFRDVPRSR